MAVAAMAKSAISVVLFSEIRTISCAPILVMDIRPPHWPLTRIIAGKNGPVPTAPIERLSAPFVVAGKARPVLKLMNNQHNSSPRLSAI